MERYRPKPSDAADKPKRRGAYFTEPPPLRFIPTGCTLLNCVISGGDKGWPLGRCVNIIGDKSTGKSLLAIEAAANFAKTYPRGQVWYRESEAAFDLDYANRLGLPEDRVDFGSEGIDTQWDTVEDVMEDLDRILARAEKDRKHEGLYIIDSLDALSTRVALKREIGKGSYNLDKPKAMSELFNKYVRRLKKTNICMMVISQVRDNIGVTFGEKYKRSGGHALDFYASICLWLSHIKTHRKTVNGITRPVSVQIRARCKKNKVAQPFRECEFFIRFGYGVDDLEANLSWLSEAGRLSTIERGLTEAGLGKFIKRVENSGNDYEAWMAHISQITADGWAEVEKDFLPTRSKYGGIRATAA